jgi:protein TonB
MSRGLPFSLSFHVLVTVLMLVYGNQVTRRPPRPPQAMNVKMVRLPQTRPVETVTETPVEPAPQQPKPEVKPELPPKQKPEPEKPKPEVKKEPEPEIKAVEPEVVDDPPAVEAEPAPAQIVTGPSVSATDSDFPFAQYLSTVESRIHRNWNPHQMGRLVSCTLHFKIARNGTVSQVTLIRNSGVGVYDRESIRAVSTTRLPPLPPQYRGTFLGITLTFNLEPGS